MHLVNLPVIPHQCHELNKSILTLIHHSDLLLPKIQHWFSMAGKLLSVGCLGDTRRLSRRQSRAQQMSGFCLGLSQPLSREQAWQDAAGMLTYASSVNKGPPNDTKYIKLSHLLSLRTLCLLPGFHRRVYSHC